MPVRLDYPGLPRTTSSRASLGADFEPVLAAMQARAPVDLRVNTLKTNPDAATVVLARDGVQVERHPLARDALRVLENPRLVAASRAYTQGMVELQDASSQLVAETAGVRPGMTVLDYCAGGGGKTLALAAELKGRGRLLAWDVNPRRMADLPERARRAGAEVRILSDAECAALGPVCDLVLADAPCSGTGAWRRKPEGKWRLTPGELDRFPAAAGFHPRRRRPPGEAGRDARLLHLLAPRPRERGARRRLRRAPPRLAVRGGPAAQPARRRRRLLHRPLPAPPRRVGLATAG